MKKKIFFAITFNLLFLVSVYCQWDESENNYTTGDLGIGTSNYQGKLTIDGVGNFDDDGTLIFLSANKSQPELFNLRLEKKFVGTSAAPAYQWEWNMKHWSGLEGNVMTINKQGNIGIGTDKINGKLTIDGVGNFDDDGTLIFLSANKNQPELFNLRLEKKFVGTSAAPAYQWEWNMKHWSGLEGNVMTINKQGNIGIGKTNPDYKLDVCGTIRAEEIKVSLDGGCDFVFKNDYELLDLKSLEKFVKTKHHLPEIASEQEMIEDGVNMKEFQMKLLQKIEELTLYTIEQNKKLERQDQEMQMMKEKIENLESLIE